MSAVRPAALLLDVMDTLVYDPFRECVPEVFGLSVDAYFAIKDRAAYEAFERGAVDVAHYARTMFTDGRHADLDALQARYVERYRYLDGVPELLSALSRRGVPMHALSNYSVFYELIEHKLALSRWVAWTFVSCRTGLRKPEPAAYLLAVRALGLQPEQVLFVDDRAKNCAAAASLGLLTHTFVDAPTLARELLGLGLLDDDPLSAPDVQARADHSLHAGG